MLTTCTTASFLAFLFLSGGKQCRFFVALADRIGAGTGTGVTGVLIVFFVAVILVLQFRFVARFTDIWLR